MQRWEGVTVTYDPEADAFYVDLQPGVQRRNGRERSAWVDYAEDGSVAGLELF